MKAIIYTKYGSPDVLQLKEMAKPTPKDDEVLIQVMATAVNAADWRLLRANPFFVRFFAGLLKPKNPILGADVAGVVETVGQNVTQFQPGDAVFGDLSGAGFGGFAEYVCAPEAMVAAKPTTVSFAQAAAMGMAAITALQGLRDVGNIQPGDNVLIHGASGGVGTFAVQIAKALGGGGNGRLQHNENRTSTFIRRRPRHRLHQRRFRPKWPKIRSHIGRQRQQKTV